VKNKYAQTLNMKSMLMRAWNWPSILRLEFFFILLEELAVLSPLEKNFQRLSKSMQYNYVSLPRYLFQI
jgi:hypothetical protein